MAEHKERGGESQVESALMIAEEVLQKMKKVTGRDDLEICPEVLLLDKEGKVRSLGTKTIWDKEPDEYGIYHGIAFWFEPAEGRENRREWKEFGNIIYSLNWSGVKKGDIIEEDEVEGGRILADW